VQSTFVALDLETTGLNTERDAIIEVAAVRFADGRVLAEFETFVQPEVDLSFRTRQITGLSPADLEGAPPVEAVVDDLAHFVGSDPVVGHSADHDLAFLRRFGVLLNHPVIDTFELACIMVPEARRYSVGHLVDLLVLDASAALHRALADAHAHRLLFEALVERARRLDADRLAAINRLAEGVDWPMARVFKAAATSPLPPDAVAPPPDDLPPPMRPAPSRTDLDPHALEQLIGPGGALERLLPGCEDRPGQQHMLRRVCEAFNYGGQLMVEAGTGTGKSLAYLLPAAAWALANGRPVVITTHTINLQDQLVHNDLPIVEQLLDAKVRGTVLKGRANYLCRIRLAGLLARGDLDLDGVRAAAKILVWEGVTRTGDRAEPMLQREEARTWRLVSAESDACSAENCAYALSGDCWLHRARRRAEGAHVIVVNHALLVSDMLTENRLLPRHGHLIIDEAHHLEAVATQALGVRLSQSRLRDVVAVLDSGGSGLLARTAAGVAKSDLSEDARRSFAEGIGNLQRTALRVAPTGAVLFAQLEEFVAEHVGDRASETRLTDATRAQPAWLAVEIACDELQVRLGELRRGLSRLVQGLVAGVEFVPNAEALLTEMGAVQRELVEIGNALTRTISRPTTNDVLWTSRGEGGRVTLHAAPLHVGPIVAQSLFADKETLVLTSATLRAGEGFEFLRDRLSLPDADSVVVSSPFDYAQSTLLYLPTDLPEPNHPEYQLTLDQILVALVRAVGGRTLVLYTSYSGLKRSYRHLTEPLGQSGITVLGQGIDGGRQKLLEQFRTGQAPTVLLGTRSFWEGIDVPGEALSCLAIVRLPFDVPTDPVFEARAETFDDPFRDYAVPQAVLRFRQGFGRLIRSTSDRGVVAVLDSRIRSKSYGQWFLDALPPCQQHIGPLHTLPELAARFLSDRDPRAGEPLPTPEGAGIDDSMHFIPSDRST